MKSGHSYFQWLKVLYGGGEVTSQGSSKVARTNPWGLDQNHLSFLFVLFSMQICHISRLPRWRSGKEYACQCRRPKRPGFYPWVGKIPWRRTWQSIPVFLPGKFRGQRSLVGYSPWGHKELATIEWLTLTLYTQNLIWFVLIRKWWLMVVLHLLFKYL